MIDEPVDLSALDPASDRLRMERLVREISRRAAPKLAERRRSSRQQINVYDLMLRWRRRLIAASALIAVPAITATLWRSADTQLAADSSTQLASELAMSLGVPLDLLPYLTLEQPPR